MFLKLTDILVLALLVLACFSAAWFGSRFTVQSMDPWYAELNKPSWTPPGWVFAPAWTVLYATMALAAWLVWLRRSQAPRAVWIALVLFAVQLLLNAAWSAFFFGLRNPQAAFWESLALLTAVAGTTAAFRRVRPAAAWIMLPYLAWTGFASILNFAIWRMNA